LIGITIENMEIPKALAWFTTRQQEDGTWKLTLLRNKEKDLSLWISLAI